MVSGRHRTGSYGAGGHEQRTFGLPANVRAYTLTGTTHFETPGSVSRRIPAAAASTNPLHNGPTMRAQSRARCYLDARVPKVEAIVGEIAALCEQHRGKYESKL